VLRLPTLDVEYKPAIDSLMRENLARLRVTPYLIVDLRGNGGGCTCAYDAVTPLLYTDPIHSDGMDVLSSAANTAWLRDWATTHEAEFSERDKALYGAALSRLDAHPNQFVVLSPDSVVTRDMVYSLPRKVAVLVDGGCASSCEDFVLEARQSRKVTVLGFENTSGMHDYGDVRGVPLPGWRRLRVPIARSRGERIDFIGLAPAVRIPKDVADPVEFARRYLRAAGGGNE
jgi:C-terminal processing protease CtpA/Prc